MQIKKTTKALDCLESSITSKYYCPSSTAADQNNVVTIRVAFKLIQKLKDESEGHKREIAPTKRSILCISLPTKQFYLPGHK